jgi:NAD(P)-dependent dehydrogenase (short-subunit alcohol dehydrogenase family)
MQIGGSIALVTGANRGLGLAFTRELVRRGAATVYGAARRQDQVTEPGVTPVGLDITDQAEVVAAAARCADVSLLVNNAGVMNASTFTGAPSLEAARAEMETNYFGTLSMCRAFAPVLAANGGGAIVNMLSFLGGRPGAPVPRRPRSAEPRDQPTPATPTRLPSGSVKWPTTRPDGARSGPIRRFPPRLSALARAASTSGTAT